MRRAKEAASDNDDLEQAAGLRDREKHLAAQITTARRDYRAVTREVGKADVAEALAVVSGTSAADVLSEPLPERQPKYPPSAMTAADKEIWAMS